MPRKKQEKKLRVEDIKKNPDIEKKHFINKFIEHEHEIMLCTTALFMILICAVIYIGAVTIENKDKVEIYYDGSLKIRYNIDISGVSDVVTLDEDNIVFDDYGEEETFTFSITNDSLTSVRYNVYLEDDKGMVKLDGCGEKLVNHEAIRYKINDGKELSLKAKEEDGYLLKSGIIGPSKTKEYKLKAWIDKDSMEDVHKNHYHGRIIVVNIEE